MISLQPAIRPINNEDKNFYQEQIKHLMTQIQNLADKNSELEKMLLECLKKGIQSVETPKSKNVG